MTARDCMEYDVVIVGAGPAGLSAAIRLKQLALENGHPLSVCVLEKGAQVGAHILSGACIETRALDELLPNWQNLAAPIDTPVTQDRFVLLTAQTSYPLPTPPPMRNHGNYLISLGELCAWLAIQAEALGVEIYPSFAAAHILYDGQDKVIGVATGDMGLNKQGQPAANFQRGMALHARYTLFAEGCRGALSEQLIAHFKLHNPISPPTYGIGIKELWEVQPQSHQQGLVLHSIGWPVTADIYGGSFMYHLSQQRVAVGFVVGLDYQNPHLSPFDAFQQFKTHPDMAPVFAGARRIAYGARALNEGGYQSIPELSFSGGLILGDAAGFLNVPKIKGIHTAMKSGMVAAETVLNQLMVDTPTEEVLSFRQRLDRSWVIPELYQVRNIRPSFHHGLWAGLAYSALDTYILKGKAPWTFIHHADHTTLRAADDADPISYPKADGVLTFDRLSSVFLSNTYHEENQPCHLHLKDTALPQHYTYPTFKSVEARFCPAGVYEYIMDSDTPHLQINFTNCVHCKTCDIKDPNQNIVWTTPEGGNGPNYGLM